MQLQSDHMAYTHCIYVSKAKYSVCFSRLPWNWELPHQKYHSEEIAECASLTLNRINQTVLHEEAGAGYVLV